MMTFNRLLFFVFAASAFVFGVVGLVYNQREDMLLFLLSCIGLTLTHAIAKWERRQPKMAVPPSTDQPTDVMTGRPLWPSAPVIQ